MIIRTTSTHPRIKIQREWDEFGPRPDHYRASYQCVVCHQDAAGSMRDVVYIDSIDYCTAGSVCLCETHRAAGESADDLEALEKCNG